MKLDVDLSEARWQKSSRSGGNGNCVEVAFLDGGNIALRDSKDPTGPTLVFTPAEWDAFAHAMIDGEFIRPESR